MPRSRVWAHLRAALLLFVLVGSCVEGLPTPRADASFLARPVGRRELSRWRRLLGSVGIEIGEDELGERVIEVSETLRGAHDRLTDPLRPWFDATQTTQRWSLFPVADPETFRMHVDGRVDGEWTLLYRPNDPEHTLLADRIQYRRVRAVWNPSSRGARADYPRFVDWVAREIFALRADVDAVRVRHLRYEVAPPGEPVSDATRWRFEQIRTRDGAPR